jgi:hypothetical protein
MTSSLRRKHPTTAVPSMPARMAASLVGLGLLLAANQVTAQELLRPEPISETTKTLHFTKPANTITTPAQKPKTPLDQKRISPAPYVPPPPPPLVRPEKPTPEIKATANPSRQLAEPRLPIQQTFFQQKESMRGPFISPSSEEAQETLVQLVPPGPQRIFQLDSEAALQERIRQEARQRVPPERITFPEEPVVGRGPYVPRMFPAQTMLVEPNYVCYDRLFFEEKNSERYGWDLGFIQPFVSAGVFYWDLATLPYHFWSNPCQHCECSAGYCLPGDPVPFLIYPPQISLLGAVMEAGTAVALFAIFP